MLLTGEYVDMAAMLIEDLYVRFEKDDFQLLVGQVRGELGEHYKDCKISDMHAWEWGNPRKTIRSILNGSNLQTLFITCRGLRRIEELRDLLKRDRILEDFGILLSIRYFRRDLEEALKRPSNFEVSVLYLDMDDFGKINKGFGQEAGDFVMKSYLGAVQEGIGGFGIGYRGVGDETVGLVVGQGHERAMEIAEAIRRRVASLKCQYKKEQLPQVTVSIGVATTLPEARSMDIEALAESRKRKAKEGGKDRVVGS